MKCKNCGDEIRRTQPGDGLGHVDGYEWVHVYPLMSGGEIANPICDITLVAEPSPEEG
jgi:hypothetical protein